MTKQQWSLLLYLVENHPRLIEKNELHERIWRDAPVTDEAISQAIRNLRTVLSDHHSKVFIATEHGRGYRFIGNVNRAPEPSDKSSDNSREAVRLMADAKLRLPILMKMKDDLYSLKVKTIPELDHLTKEEQRVVGDAYFKSFNRAFDQVTLMFIKNKMWMSAKSINEMQIIMIKCEASEMLCNELRTSGGEKYVKAALDLYKAKTSMVRSFSKILDEELTTARQQVS